MSPTSPNPLAVLFPRTDIAGDAAQAAQTLSSWDNCMAQSYCKWPVIAAIIVGSLIVLSILFCCARCLCCGLECCCACCSCFNRCCPSPRGSKAKYSQAPQSQYQYPPQQPYGYHPGMSYGPPQFAVFDASNGKVKEDSLPAMPSWQTATTHKVEDTSYRGVDDGDLGTKEMSGANGIAMNSISTSASNEPVQYYEDPDDSHQPMLAAHQRNLSQEHSQGYAQGYPQDYSQGYGQAQYSDKMAYNQYDNASSYAGTDMGQHNAYNTPSHPYSNYDQQQDTYSNYPHRSPTSPTSAYTNTYPPTYHTRASTVRPQDMQQSQTDSPYYTSQSPPPAQQPSGQLPYQYRGASPSQDAYFTNSAADHLPRSPSNYYAPNRTSQSPAHEDSLPEMPGSLMPGGAQRMYSAQQARSPAHSPRASQDINRKPIGGGGWQ